MSSLPEKLIWAAILLPLLGVGAMLLLAGGRPRLARGVALVVSLLTLVPVLLLIKHFDPAVEVFAATQVPWFHSLGIDVQLSLGLDGLSIWLFGLAALLVVTSILVSWNVITDRPTAFYSLLLLLETGMLGVFAARDLILFYVFFEFTLIPLFFLIGIWGSEERRYAAIKFFLFTLSGSLLTFVGLLALVLWCAPFRDGTLTFSIADITQTLQQNPLPLERQVLIFGALFIGFAIKVPLFPLHTWLPLAHVQAPTAGSILLAGILLKLGTYGFTRFCLPMLPHATAVMAPYLLVLSVAGIIYGALVALAQTDIKRLIAYSSVSHLGFVMLGLFALNPIGLQGSVLQMINHGLSTGGLFAVVGLLYERYHTRQIDSFGGLARKLPILAFFLLLFTFSSIGLPGLNGFAGEFMILLAMFQTAWSAPPPGWEAAYQTIAVVAVLGVVLGAWYMLYLVQRTFFGALKEPHHDGEHEVHDLNGREIAALLPLVVLMFWIGLAPRQFLNPMAPALDRILSVQQAGMSAAQDMGRESLARAEADDSQPVLRVLEELQP